MRRGEILWAELGSPARRRLVLMLTRDEGIRVRAKVTVAPITTHARGIPTEVPLGPGDGLPQDCVADLDSLQTVEKSTLRQRVSALSSVKLAAVEDAIRFALRL